MELNEFIKLNKQYWSSFNKTETNGKLLVEEPGLLFITHCLAMQTLIINQAKSYQPIWIYSENTPIELLKSYVPTAEYIFLPVLNSLKKFQINLISWIKYLKILLNKNILSFYYDKVKYGDIIYDVYLSENKVGTIKKIDFKIFKLIKYCIKRHEIVKKLIKTANISAILVSHRIGIQSGVMLRTALRYGCEVYTSNGMHRNTLYLSKNQDEMIVYEYTPTVEDIKNIINLPCQDFNDLYDFVLDFHTSGKFTMDAKYAFSDENKYFTDRESFANAFNLDLNKKNIFVMLHAFTDYPHSHFKWMIFKDYADWFLKTLEYAKNDKSANWIFKQHPSDKFYPTKDINFEELFKDATENIVFLDVDDKLDTRSLIYVSDAIITCLGSAGFEIPAMAGVPSITAGDNHYHGLGFSLNPTNKKEYFEILNNLKNIERLTPEQQKLAKAAYIYIYYLCTVDYSFIPNMTLEDHYNPKMYDWFWGKVIDLYNSNNDIIFDEVKTYSKNVSKNDFKALRTTLDQFNKTRDKLNA